MAVPVSFPDVLTAIRPVERASGGVPQIEGARGTSFADRVADALHEVNETQKTAEVMSSDFAEGRQNDLHGTMIAMQKADVTLRLVANVRNRVIEAYREIMRMGA